MNDEIIQALIDEHKQIMIPALTHMTRFHRLAHDLAKRPVNTRSEIRAVSRRWEEMSEALKDIGEDIEALGTWGNKLLDLLSDEIEKMKD